MIVPNYVPEPLEVPGNVTELPYRDRLAFIRKVTLRLLVAVGVVAVGSYAPFPAFGLSASALVLGAVLVLLELYRIATRGKPIEGRISAWCLPVVLIIASVCVKELGAVDWPTWPTLIGCACIGLYTLLCGRDYSFIGSFLVSLIASSVAVAAMCIAYDYSSLQSWYAVGTNAVFLSYVLYDLASLMSRRRPGEEWAAVTDLFRDLFNFFGYFVRVIRHWHQHRIWNVPTPIEMPKRKT